VADGDEGRGSPFWGERFEELWRDSDRDGLTDADERERGTELHDADSDRDGIADGAEVDGGLDPTSADTDRDGLTDGVERSFGSDPRVSDTDDDGRSDAKEREDGTDPRTWDPQPKPPFGSTGWGDRDRDGVDDWTEAVIGTDPDKPDEWSDVYGRIADSDRDGLSDAAERTIGTSPFNRDTDRDGLDDLFEIEHGLDPNELRDDVPETPQKVPMRLPEAPKPRVELTQVRDDATIEDFLRNVLAQVGDQYKLGAVASLRDDDPDVWDGSELVEWAANRAGVMINDGAANQYRQLARHGGELSVDEALQTPGALLYEFTGDPIKGKPARASTAISLGDGRIIDIDPTAGVRIMDAKDFRFTHAGVMHGFTDAHEPGEGAVQVVNDALVEHGIVPATADTTSPDPTGGLPDRVADDGDDGLSGGALAASSDDSRAGDDAGDGLAPDGRLDSEAESAVLGVDDGALAATDPEPLAALDDVAAGIEDSADALTFHDPADSGAFSGDVKPDGSSFDVG
jgi:hypothetical protein